MSHAINQKVPRGKDRSGKYHARAIPKVRLLMNVLWRATCAPSVVKQPGTFARFGFAVVLTVAAIASRLTVLPALGFQGHDGILLLVVVVAAIRLGMAPAILVILLSSLGFQFAAHGTVL